MPKAMQAMVLNMIVLMVFCVLVALAVIAIRAAVMDEGHAKLPSRAAISAPTAQASTSARLLGN